MLMLTIVVHHRPTDLAVLTPPLLASGLLAVRFTDHFRRSPAGFPTATPATGLRVTPPSRQGWSSDRNHAR
jgi:hypothetical protein